MAISRDAYIVTGATGNIGRAIVNELITRKVPNIILACRNVEHARQMIEEFAPHADSTTITAIHLDLTSMASVDKFAEQFLSMGLPLKALLNNAGTMPCGINITPDDYEEATQTNYLATIRLTRRLIPAMSSGSSIIFTTSMLRHFVRICDDWEQLSTASRHPLRRFIVYGRSKLMLTHYAKQLSDELNPRGIRVNCSDPGIVDSPILDMKSSILNRLSKILLYPFFNTPTQGAKPVIKAMLSDVNAAIFTKNNIILITDITSRLHHPSFDSISI